MNTRERFKAIMDFEKGIPTLKAEYGYWIGTVRRFIREGLPVHEDLPMNISDNGSVMGYEKIDPDSRDISDKNIMACFGLDPYISKMPFDISPMLAERILREDDQYKTYSDSYGIIKKVKTRGTSTPLDIEHPIKDRKDFEQYKDYYCEDYAARLPRKWKEIKEALSRRDYPVRIGGFPFGFWGFPRHLMGFTRLCFTMYDDPRLIKDINEFFSGYVMKYWSRILSEVAVDCAVIFEDMAYKSGSMISKEMFMEFLFPYYLKVVDFLKQYGITTILIDSDGFIEELIPLWVKAGITGILPLEVQAGNNLLRIRENFPKLQLLGGVNKMILTGEKGYADIEEELEKVNKLLKTGGYIPHIDHHVSEDACWNNFKYYRWRLNEIIDYE